MSPHTSAKRALSIPTAVGFAQLSADASRNALDVPAPGSSMDRTEISIRGKRLSVPAIHSNGYTLVIQGGWLKIASVHDEDWLVNEFSSLEGCLSSLRALARKDQPDIFTFSQKVPANLPRHSFPMEWDSMAVASFPSYSHWWDQLPRETRKNVRRAERRGVIVGTHDFNDDLLRGIAAIQNESPIRQGRRYWHYGKNLDEIRHDHSCFIDRCDHITAHFEDEMIGFLKVVYRADVASILQLNVKLAHFDKRPANALLAKAVELCAARGISCLTYSRFNYGNKHESGLREFKSRHGFRELLMPRYYVPLTTWGNFCVKTRLYRNTHQLLPAPAIKAAVSLRAKWYKLAFSFALSLTKSGTGSKSLLSTLRVFPIRASQEPD